MKCRKLGTSDLEVSVIGLARLSHLAGRMAAVGAWFRHSQRQIAAVRSKVVVVETYRLASGLAILA